MRPLDPRLLPHLTPARVPLAGVVVASVASCGLVIAQAFAVAGLIVALFEGTASQVVRAGIVLALITTARALAGWGVDVCSAHASSVVTTSLRRRIVAAALSLGALGLSRRRSGALALLSTRGVAAVDPYLTRYVPALFLAAALPPLTVLAIASQDLLSGAIVLMTLPLIPVFAILIGLATRDRADRQWQALSTLSGHFVDVMRGMPTLVAYRRAAAQSTSIRRITDRYRRATNETLKLAFASSAVLELVATISVALVAVTVGLRLSAGSLDLRTSLVVLLLAPEAYWPMRRVGAEFHAAAEGTATFEAADELFTSAATGTPSAPGPVPSLHHGIAIDSVTVTYPDRTSPALNGICGFIEPRGLTAITGPSGAGKSTLLAALMGDVPLTSGAVRVDDVNLGTIDPEAWRSQIAWVPQRPWILPGTIKENVRLARPAATDAQVLAALERVALGHLVATMPDGLDEQIGEDGAGLSAGERARLALARAVIADRPVVLLDEPTAHLDTLTEQVIATTLRWLAARSAVVVVAHRRPIVDLADHVIHVPAAAIARVPAGAPAGALVDAPADAPAESVSPAKPADDRPSPADPVSRKTASPGVLLWAAAVLGALAAASGVALTATAGWLIVRAAEHPPVLVLMVAIVGVRTFGLARPALRYAERLLSHDVALRLLSQRRSAVYAALIPLVPARLGKQRGDVLASIVDDVDALVDKHLRVRAPLLTFVMVSAVATAFTTWILPAAGLVTLAVLVIGGGLAFAVSRVGVHRAEREFVDQRAQLSSLVVQTLQGSQDLIMWQATDRVLNGIDVAGQRLGNAGTRSMRAVASGRGLAVLTAGIGMIGMAWVGSAGLASETVSKPILALMVLLPLALLEVMTPLADAGALQVRTAAADARIAALLLTEPAVADPAHPLPHAVEHSSLRVNSVTAGWGDEAAFRHVSFELQPGNRIGVVGPSGCGKSTLAAVLLRFLDPHEGTLTLGKADARDLRLDDVRRTVGLVDDDPHIFGSTLLENIRLAGPAATDEEIDDALRSAQLGAWVNGLPRGVNTMIGDGHAPVSGGERARIGLARAILADQPVLVLDEPTAHLDSATATAVTDDLLGASGSRSIIWITHGTIGLDKMDAVLELDQSARLAPVG